MVALGSDLLGLRFDARCGRCNEHWSPYTQYTEALLVFTTCKWLRGHGLHE
jgi:hypothetical protein